jgi:hypothetical protein
MLLYLLAERHLKLPQILCKTDFKIGEKMHCRPPRAELLGHVGDRPPAERKAAQVSDC